jgi:serine/threonine protein kinase
MGNCNFKTDKAEEDLSNNVMSKNLYNLQYIVGRGGFGKVNFSFIQVWKVDYKRTKELFAMKIMSKFKVYQKKSITSVLNEKNILENLDNSYLFLICSFIVNMHHAFQDKEFLYLMMDYLPGGDLRYHIIRNVKFNEEKTSKSL